MFDLQNLPDYKFLCTMLQQNFQILSSLVGVFTSNNRHKSVNWHGIAILIPPEQTNVSRKWKKLSTDDALYCQSQFIILINLFIMRIKG